MSCSCHLDRCLTSVMLNSITNSYIINVHMFIYKEEKKSSVFQLILYSFEFTQIRSWCMSKERKYKHILQLLK